MSRVMPLPARSTGLACRTAIDLNQIGTEETCTCGEVADQIDTSELPLSSPCAASTGHAASVPGPMVTRRQQLVLRQGCRARQALLQRTLL